MPALVSCMTFSRGMAANMRRQVAGVLDLRDPELGALEPGRLVTLAVPCEHGDTVRNGTEHGYGVLVRYADDGHDINLCEVHPVPTRDLEIDVAPDERDTFSTQPLHLLDPDVLGEGAAGLHHAVPRQVFIQLARAGQDAADIAGGASADVFRDVAVGHHPPGWDGADAREHGLVEGGRGCRPETARVSALSRAHADGLDQYRSRPDNPISRSLKEASAST